MLRWCVALLVFLYLLKIYLEWRPGYVIDHEFANVVPGPSSANVLAEECSNATKICYGVMDYAEDEYGLRVRRVIYVKGFEKEVDTMVTLIPPAGRSFKDSDTRFWAVNHSDIGTQYTAVMSVFPFALGSVPALSNPNGNASLFVVGLGGGSMDMFFHQLRPKWQIDVFELDPLVVQFAHRWFGVVEDESRRTHVQDGLVALAEAVKRNQTYDVLLVDACSTDTLMPCPAADFLRPEHLRNMRAALKPTGVVVINVLVLSEIRQDEQIQTVERQLLAHFPTCLVMKMNLEENAIVGCLPYALEPSTVAQTKKMWKEQLNGLLEHFAFNFEYSNLPPDFWKTTGKKHNL
ncbi:hypothetical protein M3Y99_00033200 [Aphelenchoides fujianensis]|nr:hypothetical protein M3Y99_00033200 [Aphelenchoides fujianensis]